jgi:hypothetical protein
MSNLAITRHFVAQLEAGNPIQALVWANGAARQHTGLRKVLVARASEELPSSLRKCAPDLCQQLLAGHAVDELTHAGKLQLEAFRKQQCRTKHLQAQRKALQRSVLCRALATRPLDLRCRQLARRTPVRAALQVTKAEGLLRTATRAG